MNLHEPISDADVRTLEYIIGIFKSPVRVLEIGCGRSSDVFLSKGCDLTIIDIDTEKMKQFKGRAKTFTPGTFVSFEDYDIVFIDGDHRYEYVSIDIDNAISVAKNNGIICGHDYESRYYDELHVDKDTWKNKHHGVIKAVNEAFGSQAMKAPRGTVWWYCR